MPRNHRVFSPKSGKKRESVARPAIGFRGPADVVEWLEKLKSDGLDRSQVIIDALRVSRDVSARIGDKWFEIEYRAKKKGIEPGAMLAELALSAIAAERNGTPLPAAEPTANGPANNRNNKK